MRVEHLISVTFTEEELKEALLCMMECDLNDTAYGTLEHTRRKEMIDHVKSETCSMDWVNGQFCLSADGVAKVEEF